MPDKGYPDGAGLAAASLRQALQDMPEVAELSKNIIVAPSQRGVDVSIVDQDGASMFPMGRVDPMPVPDAFSSGLPGPAQDAQSHRHHGLHRDGATRSAPSRSAVGALGQRAISVREILAGSGVPDDRFAAVTGKADTEPLFPDNPYLPANRRVTVTLSAKRHRRRG